MKKTRTRVSGRVGQGESQQPSGDSRMPGASPRSRSDSRRSSVRLTRPPSARRQSRRRGSRSKQAHARVERAVGSTQVRATRVAEHPRPLTVAADDPEVPDHVRTFLDHLIEGAIASCRSR